MKKLCLLTAIMLLSALTLTAQEQDRDRIQDQDRTKLVMINGEMLELRDRAEMHLREKQTLEDGTVVFPNGQYQTRDGLKFRLKDGECLDNDGIKYRNEYQYRYKVRQENRGLTESQIQERNQNRIYYTLVDGDMYLVRNQSQHRIQDKIDLGNGVVVNADGTYQNRERKQLQLKDGECINMDGEVFRNMYQYRKMIVQKKQMPAKKMIKKGVKPSPVKKGKKSTS